MKYRSVQRRIKENNWKKKKKRITGGVGNIWEVPVFLFSPDAIYTHHLEENW